MTILPFRWLILPFAFAGAALLVLDVLWAKQQPAGLVRTLWTQEHWLGGTWYADQRQKAGQWCFALAVALFELRMIVGSSMMQDTGKFQAVLFDLTMMLLLAKIVLFTRYSYRQALTAMVLMCPYFLAQIFVPNHMMMIAYFTMLAAKDVDFRHALKVCMTVTVPAVLAVIAMSYAGVIDTITTSGEVGRGRSSLGFAHPNTAGLFLLFLFTGWLLLRFHKLRWWDIAGLAAICAVVQWKVDSRGPVLAMLTILILMFVLRFAPRFFECRPIQWLFAASPAIVFAGLLGVSALYDPDSAMWVKLNVLSSDRLRLCNGALRLFPIELIVREKPFTEDIYTAENIFFDNLYEYGVLCLAVLLICMTVLLIRCIQRKAWPELIVITGMLAFGAFEIFPKSPYSNVMMWMWAPVLFGLPAQRLQLFVPQPDDAEVQKKQ